MRALIATRAGHAGVSIGNGCCDLYCLGHGIEPDGRLPSEH
jgi:tubulin alpha